MLQHDQTDHAGVYEVKIADPAYELKFAAQSHPSESSMDELTLGQVNNLKAVANMWSRGRRDSRSREWSNEIAPV